MARVHGSPKTTPVFTSRVYGPLTQLVNSGGVYRPLAGTLFPVPPRGGRVGLSGWLHTKTAYPQTVTHLSN